jgi:HlyD family secretion protein
VPQDLVSIVTASGEVKPKQFVNIGANAFGKITRLYVKEGDKVQRGAPLAQIENVQSSAEVAATRSELQSSRTDALAAEAALKTAQADLARTQADAQRARLDRFKNPGVARASAQIAVKADLDLFQSRFRISPQERCSSHQHTRCAITALKCAVLQKQPLQLVQLTVLGEPLYRGDLFPLAARGQHDATVDRHTVEQNRAGAAVTGLAAALGAGHPEPFS